jgi:short-chain fatty acids transporter
VVIAALGIIYLWDVFSTQGGLAALDLNQLHVNLGWMVQVYNAAEALPNFINPFWMLPLMGLTGVKARDLAGYSTLQLIFHAPVVLIMLWLLGKTLPYVPPM